MNRHTSKLAVLAVLAAGLLPAAAAQAQSYNAAPLEAYAMQPKQPQPKQMTPKPHMGPAPSHMHNYHPQAHMHHYPSMRRTGMSMHMRPRCDRMHGRFERRVVEEFRGHRRRHASYVDNTGIGNSEYVRGNTEYVRDEPTVIEHERYVDEPPRVIEQQVITEEAPVRARCNRGLFVRCDGGYRGIGQYGGEYSGEYGGQRVINADAQITIIGPDRMSIELHRRGYGATMTGQ
jgi:hypothetical protein